MSKSYWVMPDTNQEGKLWVINSENSEKISLSEFYKKYNLIPQPKEFIIGIPDELLNSFKSDTFGFAQLVINYKENISILTISKRCGKDINQRTITITYIKFLNNLNENYLPNRQQEEFLLTKGISFNLNDQTKNNIEKMKRAALNKEYRSLSSERLKEQLYTHEWNGRDPIFSKKKFYIILITILILILLVTLRK